MATDFDPYRILQIPLEASDEDVRAAYGRMSGIVRDGEMNHESTRAVDAAYRILSDTEQRRAYDQRRTEAIARGYVMPAEGAEEILHPQRARVPWGFMDIFKAIGVMVGGLIVTGIPIYLVAEAIAGDKAVEDDPNAWALVLASNFIVQFLMFGTAYWFSVHKYRLDLGALGWRRPVRGRVLLTIGLVFAAFAITMSWGILLQALGIEPDTDLPEQTYEDIRPIIALVILSIFLAPLAEETFFRGFVFGALRPRWGFALAAIASGLLFSVAHIGNPGYLVVLPSIVGIGVLFAWGYYWSGSLFPGIIAHLVFNSVSVAYSIAAA
jgi:membrane protease YdiL (CAAX protease family)